MNDMTITSAQYYRDIDDTKNVGVKSTIDGQELFIPLDTANRHYDEIMRQVEAGTLTIQDAS